jgi:4'-phosphopantetheinyl transferase
LVLPACEIHVWRLAIRSILEPLDALADLLAPDEFERARRFRFDEDRKEFITSRGTLRLLLANYLSAAPAQLSFQYTEYGRPKLAVDSPIDFNVSHSRGMLLFAFASKRRVGIDVERIRRDFSTLEIAERFFSESERKDLRNLPAEQRHEAFFRCWTRKEAFIKALGEGLSHPLDQFDVSLAKSARPILQATRPDPDEVRNWLLWDIEVPEGYAATLAGELV